MSFTVFQIGPVVAQNIFPKTPFLYGMSRAFTKVDVRALLKDGSYGAVAKFNVDTLDEVYEVSNSGRAEHKIERMERMHSVSVGDVIVDDTGYVWVVAPDGFDALGEKLEQVLVG